MFDVLRLTTVEMYYSDSGELRQRTTFHIFGRPVVVSWEGRFRGSPRVFDLCDGTVGVYPQDADFDPDKVTPPLVRDEAAPDGMLRLNVVGSGRLKLIACVLLPNNCVAWPASPTMCWPPSDLVKHGDSGRISMVFIGEGSVRLLLQIAEDAGEWQRLDPDQVRHLTGIGEEPLFATDEQADGHVRYIRVPEQSRCPARRQGIEILMPYEPEQHVPVFVGSTYEDLRPYRDAVRDALVRMEYIVQGMEYFGSRPGSPKEECLKAVRSCRVYIGVFAMRYGSVDGETGKSMTHLEYEEALRLGLPMLIYLIDEQKQPVLPGHFDTGENAEKLRALKAELKEQFTVSFFTTSDDLARRVSQDLPPVLEALGIEMEERQTATPAGETKGMAEASVNQANATADTLRHLQWPVLVLRIHQLPDEHRVPIQIQNVGEGAAIWPAVYTEDEECVHNRLFPGPHIFPPHQFDEDDAVVQRQRFDLPSPTTGECFLVVRCVDPRTGGALRQRWRVWRRDPSAWFADPVTEVEYIDSG